MAAVSLSISRGNDGFKVSDFTVGTSAPGTGDFEFRIAATAGIKRKDAIIALKAFERALESGALITNAPPI